MLCTASVRLGLTIVSLLALPALGRAQVAARPGTAQPSSNLETHRQHDSLAVHFLRSPKAKPSANRVARAQKTRGTTASGPDTASAVLATPLPARARVTKP